MLERSSFPAQSTDIQCKWQLWHYPSLAVKGWISIRAAMFMIMQPGFIMQYNMKCYSVMYVYDPARHIRCYQHRWTFWTKTTQRGLSQETRGNKQGVVNPGGHFSHMSASWFKKEAVVWMLHRSVDHFCLNIHTWANMDNWPWLPVVFRLALCKRQTIIAMYKHYICMSPFCTEGTH